MKVQVLVTTMHQSDLSIYEKMNIQTDAIIANQCNNNGYDETFIKGNLVQFVSTTTRGLSRNRNIALSHCDQNIDIVLFLDDDLILEDNYEQVIIDEFNLHPNAEAIKFNIHDLSEKRKISMKRIEKFEKATRRNMSSSGVCGFAIKIEVLRRLNLFFNEGFGAGTENYCGEDTIFLQTLINKKVKMYRSPLDIAGICQDESTWFKIGRAHV